MPNYNSLTHTRRAILIVKYLRDNGPTRFNKVLIETGIFKETISYTLKSAEMAIYHQFGKQEAYVFRDMMTVNPRGWYKQTQHQNLFDSYLQWEDNTQDEVSDTLEVIPTIEIETNKIEMSINIGEIIFEKFGRYSLRSLVAAIGNQLNDRKGRFNKSTLIEYAFEVYSKGWFSYVDDLGWDLVDQVRNKVEIKYGDSMVLTKVKREPKTHITASIKNSYGTTKSKNDISYADIYIFVEKEAMVMCSGKTVKKYISEKDTSLQVNIPFDETTIVYMPKDFDSEVPEILPEPAPLFPTNINNPKDAIESVLEAIVLHHNMNK